MPTKATEPKPASLESAYRARLQSRADALAELLSMTAESVTTAKPLDAHHAMQLAEIAGLEPNDVREALDRQKKRAELLPQAQKAGELFELSSAATRKIRDENAAIDAKIKELEKQKRDVHRTPERAAFDLARDAAAALESLRADPLLDAELDLLDRCHTSTCSEIATVETELADLTEGDSTRGSKSQIAELKTMLAELADERDRLTERMQAMHAAAMPGLT